MSGVVALNVDIGNAAAAPANALTMGWHDGADVPFRPGEDFPFDDRAVGSIACGAFVHDVDRAAMLHLLLECRRTLRPGGRVTIEARVKRAPGRGDALDVHNAPGGDDMLRDLAALAGLDPTADGYTKREPAAPAAILWSRSPSPHTTPASSLPRSTARWHRRTATSRS